jgi:hypothetical protein
MTNTGFVWPIYRLQKKQGQNWMTNTGFVWPIYKLKTKQGQNWIGVVHSNVNKLGSISTPLNWVPFPPLFVQNDWYATVVFVS